MKVKVEYLGFVKNMLNKRFEEFELREDTLLQDLLSKMSNLHGKRFRKEVFEPNQENLKYGFVATVNGVLIGQLEGLKTKLKNGDHVILMSLMSGG